MEENNTLLKQLIDEQNSKMMKTNELLQSALDKGAGLGGDTSKPAKPKRNVIKISEEQNRPIKKDSGVLAWVDREVNLMWEVKQADNMNQIYVFDDAVKFVANLNKIKYAGFTDWRLPTRDELKSLASQSKTGYIYIKKTLSENTNYTYWSGTKHNIEIMWIMNYKTGDVAKNGRENFEYIRAVRNFSDS